VEDGANQAVSTPPITRLANTPLRIHRQSGLSLIIRSLPEANNIA